MEYYLSVCKVIIKSHLSGICYQLDVNDLDEHHTEELLSIRCYCKIR